MKEIRTIRENLSQNSYNKMLADLYCRSEDSVDYYKDRLQSLLIKYQEHFGADDTASVGLYTAAGRTEICGNHTDHQRGRVLTGSVDLDAVAFAAANGTNTVNLLSIGFGELSVNLDKLEPVKEEENTSYALIRGIAARIKELGHPVRGFDICMTSDVPGGSGLSSSACFEVLIGTAMNDLFCGNSLSMVDIAMIGQYAENVFFGKPSGLMDQMGCAVGGIVTIDFADKEHPNYHAVEADFSKSGYALCIIDSGADHADLTDAYTAIPVEMKQAASYFGKEVLSQVPEEDFYHAIPEIRKLYGDRAVLRAGHYYIDNAHVKQAVDALERDDFDSFIAIIHASGTSSYKYLQNIATYKDTADQPVAYALLAAEHALGGKGAVRVHGGGFAGTIQAFVPMDMTETFAAKVDATLKPGACRVTYIRPVGGAVLI